MYGNLIITEGYRKKKHSNDLHGVSPVRAIDLRSWIYEAPERLEEEANEYWFYDPDRPRMQCVVYHNSGSGNHFHLQVHSSTIKRR